MQFTNSTRRGFAALFAMALAASALHASRAAAQAAAWPTKPITLIVPGAGGGSADNIARVYADSLSRQLGQPILIDIRAGGLARMAGDTPAEVHGAALHRDPRRPAQDRLG